MPKETCHAWTDEQEQWLRDMVRTPASYGELTRSFNTRFNTRVSRSALLGKCSRMGIRGDKVSSKSGARANNRVRTERRANGVQINRQRTSFGTIGPAASPALSLREDDTRIDAPTSRSGPVNVDAVFDESSTMKSFLDLRRGECRWPASSDATMACGAKATIGSYCDKHALVAYRAMPSKGRNRKVLAGAGYVDTRDVEAERAIDHALESGGVQAPALIPSFLPAKEEEQT